VIEDDPIFCARLVGYIPLLTDQTPTPILPVFKEDTANEFLVAKLGPDGTFLEFLQIEKSDQVAHLSPGPLYRKGDRGLVGYRFNENSLKITDHANLTLWFESTIESGALDELPFTRWMAAERCANRVQIESAQHDALKVLQRIGTDTQEFALSSILRPAIYDFALRSYGAKFRDGLIFRLSINGEEIEFLPHTSVSSEVSAAIALHANQVWLRLKTLYGAVFLPSTPTDSTLSQGSRLDVPEKLSIYEHHLGTQLKNKDLYISSAGPSVLGVSNHNILVYRKEWDYFLHPEILGESLLNGCISRRDATALVGASGFSMFVAKSESSDGDIKIHRLNPKISKMGNIRACAIDAGSKAAIGVSDEGTLFWWDLMSYRLKAKLKLTDACLLSVDMDTDSGIAVAGSSTGEVFFVDLNSNKYQVTTSSPHSFIWLTKIRGDRAYSVDWSGEFVLWNSRIGIEIGRCNLGARLFRRGDMAPDGSAAVCVSDSGALAFVSFSSPWVLSARTGDPIVDAQFATPTSLWAIHKDQRLQSFRIINHRLGQIEADLRLNSSPTGTQRQIS
jgi:hypothetical protein